MRWNEDAFEPETTRSDLLVRRHPFKLNLAAFRFDIGKIGVDGVRLSGLKISDLRSRS